MFVVDSTVDGVTSLPCVELSPAQARAMATPLAQRILALLAQKESYPKEIARHLKVHEQKIYYHINKLQAAKLIAPTRKEYVQGAHAVYYALRAPAFVVRFTSMQRTQKLQERGIPAILAPFVTEGAFDGCIVMGSPDPHGPAMARSRDVLQALDFSMFIGSYLTYARDLVVRLDTEVSDEELRKNLIVIGGPIVNAITARLNDKLPIRFDEENRYAIRSAVTGKIYTSEAAGLIVRIPNPLNPAKSVLVVAGTRSAGTRAVVLAFIKHIDELSAGIPDKKTCARVVEGMDIDGDGVVDDAKIVE